MEKISTLILCKHFGSLMGCNASLPKNSKFISEDVLEEVVGSYRDAPPAHYLYKIDSFSCLTSPSFRRLETTDFEVGGYKWKLSLYPNGDMNKKVKDHISVYLEICETSSMPVGWEVNVVFKFFLLDQIRDKYLMLGDIGGRAKRFHEMKKEMGFSKLISIARFNDPSNGYLIDDKCLFGAEVLLVPRSTGCGEHLSIVKENTTEKFQWKIPNFSQIKEDFRCSEAFIVGNFTWHIKIYPKGNPEGRNKSMTLSLSLADSTNFTHAPKVYTKFKLLLKNQKYIGYYDKYKLEGKEWFCASSGEWVWDMTVAELKDKGYLENDTIVVEAEITVLGFAQKLS